jgi:hypothetical protein
MKAFAYVCNAAAIGVGVGIVYTRGIPRFNDDAFFLLLALVVLPVINFLALRK